MDKDRVKGKVDDAVGRAKRQVGEWTGDKETQAEGAAQQVKGKVENAWGKVKDAAREATDDVTGHHPDRRREDEDVEQDRRTGKDRDVA